MKAGWKRLRSSQKTKKGDRPVYVPDILSDRPILEEEIGMTAKETGYFGVARKVSTKKVNP